MDPSPPHGGVLKGQFTKTVPLIRGQGRLVYGLPLFPVCLPGTLPGPPYHNHLAARGKRRAGKALAEFMVPAASLASSEVSPVFVWDFLRAHANFFQIVKRVRCVPMCRHWCLLSGKSWEAAQLPQSEVWGMSVEPFQKRSHAQGSAGVSWQAKEVNATMPADYKAWVRWPAQRNVASCYCSPNSSPSDF